MLFYNCRFQFYLFLYFCIFNWFALSTLATEPPITCLAFSLDGKTIVSGSQAGLKIYSYPELTILKTVNLTINNIHDVTFSPSGDLLAVGGGNPAEMGRVEVLSWPDTKSLFVITEHSDSVMKVAWINETTIAAGSLDNAISLWDLQKRKLLKTFLGHSRGVTSLCFLNDDKTMVSTGIDQSVRVWNIESGALERSLNNHTQPVLTLKQSPNKSGLPMVASAGADRTIRFWQPTSGRMVRFIRLDSVPLDIQWLNGHSYISAICKDGIIRIIDPQSVTIVKSISAFESIGYSIAVHPKQKTIIIGGSNGKLQLLDY